MSIDWLGLSGRMLQTLEDVGDSLGQRTAPRELIARLERLETQLGPYGVDPFGFDPSYARRYLGFGAWLYRTYFRTETFGAHNVPEKRCLLVANHSGQLPYDGVMVGMACFLTCEPPRAVRGMVDRFVPNTPFISPLLARLGQVLGTPKNCRRLLADEHAILVFPEGTQGLNKSFKDRYRLQRFGHGFMRLALEMDAPIVPVAIIGAEEQAPAVTNLKTLGKFFGLPALPITPAPLCGLVPLPTRYRIHFGEPMYFTGDATEDDAAIGSKVRQVKARLSTLLKAGLTQRQHIFW